MGCVESEWYLVAWDLGLTAMRHFAVSRIKSVELKEETFEFRDFDPETYFVNRFGKFVGEPEPASPVHGPD